MTALRVLAAVALAGCNTLLGLDEGTPAEPVPPSCATGWAYRIPIDVENATGATLTDYQVAIPLDVADAVASHELAATAADLRFALDSATAPPLAFSVETTPAPATRVWVAVPELPPGTQRLYAYYGNPNAAPWQGPTPFVADVIVNPSFESTGAWTIDSSSTLASFELSTAWATDGESSLAVDAYRGKDSFTGQALGVGQVVTFPPGSDYVLIFDLFVMAASNSMHSEESVAAFVVRIGGGLTEVWRLSGYGGNITGVYRGVETAPFGAGNGEVNFGVSLNGGYMPAFAKGFFDHVRVRKHVSPEPAVRVGAEEDACAE